MELTDIPMLIENVDTSRYRAADRKIRHVFNGASAELVAMAINFARSAELGVPGGHGRGWEKRKAALGALLEGGYVEPLYGHWHDMTGGRGRCRTYRRTGLFKRTFSFRLPPRLAVTPSSLLSTYEDRPMAHNRIKVNSIPALSTYANLMEGVELSLSNGGQVFRRVNLYRKEGKRLYAYGIYNYQNGILKEDRHHLLINGEAVVELDFSAMHGNLLLNRVGQPCRTDFYECILKKLGVAPTKHRRDAVKQMVNASFNINSIRGYAGAAGRAVDKNSGKRLIEILGVKPKQVYEAILRAHPKLAPYICTGKHWEWLQTTDSEIMMDMLETLAKMGVAGLPLHDSVIAPAKHADAVRQVMSECYKRKMGFEPYVKVKVNVTEGGRTC
jgi:hypothetical protein